MLRTPSLLLALSLALACAACRRDAPADQPAADAAAAGAPAATSASPSTPPAHDDVRSHASQSVPLPAADTPTPAMADGAAVTYTCDDGDLVVRYGSGTAHIALPGGGSAEATRSAEASAKSGGEVYVGQRIGLQRIGNAVELQQADGPTRRCIEASSDA